MFYATDGAVAASKRVARHRPDGGSVWRNNYFGPMPYDPIPAGISVEDLKQQPQFFLVQQSPEVTLGAHFHFVDQFQLVTGGAGRIGQHAVRPYSLHFSSPCTGYGPIVPGPEGVHYLTMRARADLNGTQYLPEARDKMLPGPRRNVIVDDIVTTDPATGWPAQSEHKTYVEEDAGLYIASLRMAPHSVERIVAPHAGGGMALVVLNGTVECAASTYGPLSAMFIDAGDDIPVLRSAEGADVLILQYPRA